eukprot:2028468-Amphidinium_carterae.2
MKPYDLPLFAVLRSLPACTKVVLVMATSHSDCHKGTICLTLNGRLRTSRRARATVQVWASHSACRSSFGQTVCAQSWEKAMASEERPEILCSGA